MEKEHEKSPGESGESYGLGSPTRLQNFYLDGRADSPAYVKWDFDLPPVSEKIKKEAKELGREIKEQCPIRRKSSLKRTSPYCSIKKKSEETPSKNLSYCRSVKLLKEAIGELPNVMENVVPESPESTTSEKCSTSNVNEEEQDSEHSVDLFDDKCSVSNITRVVQDHNRSPDLFDDSLNDFMNECSQTAEKIFYNNETPQKGISYPKNRGKDESTAEQKKSSPSESSSTAQTPLIKRPISKEVRGTPRNLCDELDELDDDFFLGVDF